MAISRMQQPRQMYQDGSIMPRLNELGTEVSSAEQMLQEINQRLDSAESTLGGGGATQQPASLASDVFTSAGVTGGPQVSDLSQPLFDKDGFRLGDQRYGTGLVGGPSMALPGSGLTNQTPLAGSGGISEIDMPIAGGNNNAGGILPVESQLPGFRDEKAEYYTGKDYGPGNQAYAAVMPQEGMRFVYD